MLLLLLLLSIIDMICLRSLSSVLNKSRLMPVKQKLKIHLIFTDADKRKNSKINYTDFVHNNIINNSKIKNDSK